MVVWAVIRPVLPPPPVSPPPLPLLPLLMQSGLTCCAVLLFPVTCCAGTVNTKMLLAGWGSIGMRVSEANDAFKAATDPALAAVSGAYFVGGRQARPPGVALDKTAQQQLWAVLEQQAGAWWGI